MTALKAETEERVQSLPSRASQQQRFTLDGSEALEERLSEIAGQVREGVLRIVGARKLEGLLLAGGYGRGEGGVLRTVQGDFPYNDLEFYVFVRGPLLLNERRYQHLLNEFAEELSHKAGIEVELKVFSLAKLRNSEVTMFFYDLVVGHRLIFGPTDLLSGCEHHRHPQRIPLAEASRLLMNRCSGLLFAAEQLSRETFGTDEADFVERNLNKLRLALGDAVLTAFGQYYWSCRERHARLARLQTGLSWESEVLAQHSMGVEFKLHPFKSNRGREELQQQHQALSRLAEAVWLWLESRRLGIEFASPEGYILTTIPKWPESPAWRSLLMNARCFRRRAIQRTRLLRHPRERVLNALVLLLWTTLSPAYLQRVEEELCLAVCRSKPAQDKISTADFRNLVMHYRHVWSKVN